MVIVDELRIIVSIKLKQCLILLINQFQLLEQDQIICDIKEMLLGCNFVLVLEDGTNRAEVLKLFGEKVLVLYGLEDLQTVREILLKVF